ncbi:MAG: nucleotidyltransferase family protein [Candidatus Woesearchaeota archaeon]
MPYTEIRKKNTNTYFYRVRSVRKKDKVTKERVYLGNNLSKEQLEKKEYYADMQLLKNKELDALIVKIRTILKKRGVKKASLFGSYAQGKQRKNSDIDILIEPPRNIGFGFVSIEQELEKTLSRKVDVITYNSISPFLREEILKHEVKIL